MNVKDISGTHTPWVGSYFSFLWTRSSVCHDTERYFLPYQLSLICVVRPWFFTFLTRSIIFVWLVLLEGSALFLTRYLPIGLSGTPSTLLSNLSSTLVRPYWCLLLTNSSYYTLPKRLGLDQIKIEGVLFILLSVL